MRVSIEKKTKVKCFFCDKETVDYISNKRLFCSKRCWYMFKKRATLSERMETLEKILKKHENSTQNFLIEKYGYWIRNCINYHFGSLNKAKDFFGIEKNLSGKEKTFNKYKMNKNLAYIVGVCLGDACVNKKYYNYIVRLSCKDKDFAEEFSKRLSIILNRKVAIRKCKRGNTML